MKKEIKTLNFRHSIFEDYSRTCNINVNLNKKFLCISVLLVAMFAITSFDIDAFAEISLSSYDSTVGPTDRLLIMGTIEGDFQSFHPIQLVVYDPLGNIVYRPDVPIDGDGIFQYLITAPMPKFDDGVCTVEANF